jgi:hypothetical protein
MLQLCNPLAIKAAQLVPAAVAAAVAVAACFPFKLLLKLLLPSFNSPLSEVASPASLPTTEPLLLLLLLLMPLSLCKTPCSLLLACCLVPFGSCCSGGECPAALPLLLLRDKSLNLCSCICWQQQKQQ